MREMRELLNQLMKTDNPFTCPHGRPVIVKYDAKDLAGLFKRT
jgi:DNA mismatch repair protein MutL